MTGSPPPMRLTIWKLALPVVTSNGMTSVCAGSVNVIVPARSALARDDSDNVIAPASATPMLNFKNVPFFIMQSLLSCLSTRSAYETYDPIETRTSGPGDVTATAPLIAFAYPSSPPPTKSVNTSIVLGTLTEIGHPTPLGKSRGIVDRTFQTCQAPIRRKIHPVRRQSSLRKMDVPGAVTAYPGLLRRHLLATHLYLSADPTKRQIGVHFDVDRALIAAFRRVRDGETHDVEREEALFEEGILRQRAFERRIEIPVVHLLPTLLLLQLPVLTGPLRQRRVGRPITSNQLQTQCRSYTEAADGAGDPPPTETWRR